MSRDRDGLGPKCHVTNTFIDFGIFSNKVPFSVYTWRVAT